MMKCKNCGEYIVFRSPIGKKPHWTHTGLGASGCKAEPEKEVE